jgi:hypothetical protein
MNKIFGLVGVMSVFTMLTACHATPQEHAQDMNAVQARLPENCELHYAGKVRVEGSVHTSPSRIFYAVCGDTTTTSETHDVPSGKATVPLTDVTVVTK